jgi:hypothetical protein
VWLASSASTEVCSVYGCFFLSQMDLAKRVNPCDQCSSGESCSGSVWSAVSFRAATLSEVSDLAERQVKSSDECKCGVLVSSELVAASVLSTYQPNHV